MHFHLVAIGTRMPEWVQAGYDDYARRLHGGVRLQLHELPPAKRTGRPDVSRARADEARRLRGAIPRGAEVIALDVGGRGMSTEKLAQRMREWQRTGASVALLVGGPDGLDESLLREADEIWSLSGMTFPHALVRVILAEQLYRGMSILTDHPYHR